MDDESTTTVQVYRSDHDYLKRRQRELNGREGVDINAYLTMPDLIRALIQAATRAGEGA